MTRLKKLLIAIVACLVILVVAVLLLLRRDQSLKETVDVALISNDTNLRLQIQLDPQTPTDALKEQSDFQIAATENNAVRPISFVQKGSSDSVAWSSEIVSLRGNAEPIPTAPPATASNPDGMDPGTAFEPDTNLISPGSQSRSEKLPESQSRVAAEIESLSATKPGSQPFGNSNQGFSNPVLSGTPTPFPPLEQPVSPPPTLGAEWQPEKMETENDFQPAKDNTELKSRNGQPAKNFATVGANPHPINGTGDFDPGTEFEGAVAEAAPPNRLAAKSKTSTASTQGGPTAALNANDFLLASEPKLGAHYTDDHPQRDHRAWEVDPSLDDFCPDPIDPYEPFDPGRNIQVYEDKQHNANQRPLVELGRPWYQLGQLSPPSTILGAHNPVTPQFLIFGDYRTAYATNTQNDDNTNQIAFELNLFWNLQLTSTERFTMFVAPLDNGNSNTRYLLDENEFIDEYDFDVDFGYFEGDLGSLMGGLVGETLPFDLPFAMGVMPLLIQNGVWMDDFFLGVAATIPARNSAHLDISNMDFTFFAGFDEIISDAFDGEDDAAKMWGFLTFIEAMNGYWEIDYAFLEDRTARDRSYHNIGIGFTRRYGRLISNSTRMIVNAGQSTNAGSNTADGVLLLSENSLITGHPSSIVPYFNAWIGFDRPQSAARNAGAGGVLRNTGILFESDGMTGFPTLDPTANETYGAALGTNILPNDFSQQLVLEVAALGVMGDDAVRRAQGDQYGLGFRYQLPLSNSLIFRTDGMYGFLRDANDVNGFRMELRRKF